MKKTYFLSFILFFLPATSSFAAVDVVMERYFSKIQSFEELQLHEDSIISKCIPSKISSEENEHSILAKITDKCIQEFFSKRKFIKESAQFVEKVSTSKLKISSNTQSVIFRVDLAQQNVKINYSGLLDINFKYNFSKHSSDLYFYKEVSSSEKIKYGLLKDSKELQSYVAFSVSF